MRTTFSDQQRHGSGTERLRNKRQWSALVAALLLLDALSVAGALTLAYFIRIDGLLPYYHMTSDAVYRSIVVVAVPLWLICFALVGLYQRDNLLGGVVEYKQVVKGCFVGVTILVAYTVFARIPDFDVSRLWLILSLVFSIALVGAMRFLVRRAVYKMRESGWLSSRVLIVGANDQGVAIAEQWMSSVASGMHVLGFLDDFKSIGTQVIGNIKVLGRPSALDDISKTLHVDEIVVVSSAVAWESFGELVTSAGNNKSYTLRLSPGFYELLTTGVAVTNKTFVPLLTINETRIVGVDAALKAIEDYGLGMLTVLFTLPLGLLFGLILKLRHPRRPVIVRNTVIGQGGRPFRMLSFNVASAGRGKSGFERWMRVTGMNKLPQLWNVLRGEMSLVGPHPRNRYDRSIDMHANHNLQSVKPGMAGPWMRRDHLMSPSLLHDELNYVRKWQILAGYTDPVSGGHAHADATVLHRPQHRWRAQGERRKRLSPARSQLAGRPAYVAPSKFTARSLRHLIQGACLAAPSHQLIPMNTPIRFTSTRALVLAAGEGTRLRPLTLDRPKPMVPINGKPLLDITLGWLKEHGIRDIAINLHYKPHVITEYFGNGRASGVNLHYSREATILGTAGAARAIRDWVDGSTLVLVYGDVLTDLDLSAMLDFHRGVQRRDPSAAVTMSLYHVPNPTEVGLVGMDENGKVNRFLEKPKAEEVFTDLANAGVLIMEPDVLDLIPENTFCDFGLHVFPMLLRTGLSIYGWVIPDNTYLLDIGSPEKYDQANRDWPARAGQSTEISLAAVK